MSIELQGRYANIKSILPPEKVTPWILELDDNASIVWARHDATVVHYHYVVRFSSKTRWTPLRVRLMSQDTHSYSRPARSWRRSVRYLLHLDNPEKQAVPRDNLSSHGIDPSELGELLGNERLPILESLVLAERLPLHKRFQFLVVERQHSPSEVSSALRCMMDLERWSESRTHAGVKHESALPDKVPDDEEGGEIFGEVEDGTENFNDFFEEDALEGYERVDE